MVVVELKKRSRRGRVGRRRKKREMECLKKQNFNSTFLDCITNMHVHTYIGEEDR